MSDELHILRPLSFGDLFDEAFSLYRKHFVVFFGIILVPSLLDFIVTLAVVPELFHITQEQMENMTPEEAIQFLESLIRPLIFTLAVSVVVGAIASAALIKAVSDSYLGRSVSIENSYRYMLPRAVPYLLTFVVIFLIFTIAAIPVGLLGVISPALGVLGAIAYLVFAIVFAFWLAFVPEVIVVENTHFLGAIGRSRELAKGNWGKIFGVVVIFALTSIIINWGSEMLVSVFPSLLIQSALLQIVSILWLPVLIIPIVLLYFDSRVRGEGYDLEHLANEMGEDANSRYQSYQ